MPRWISISVFVLGTTALGLWLLIDYTNTNFTGVRSGEPFLDAHQRAITSFAEQEGFGKSRLRRKRFWNDYSVTYSGVQYPVRFIHLIGSAIHDQPRLYTDGRPPDKATLKQADHRPLSEAEESAWAQIVAGAEFVPIEEDRDEGYLRIMAPLAAGQDCSNCHQVATGTLLGAFIYSLNQDPRHQKQHSNPVPANDSIQSKTNDQRQ